MKVTIYTADGDSVTVKQFDRGSIMDMLQAWQEEDPAVLPVAIDTDSIIYFAKRHIVRIDVD